MKWAIILESLLVQHYIQDTLSSRSLGEEVLDNDVQQDVQQEVPAADGLWRQ